jgi:hypothetical protein
LKIINFDKILEKIQAQCSYWSRFKLSLPGRISIAKTFMVSQINYLGSVFSPSDTQRTDMQNLLNSFIKKTLKFQMNVSTLHQKKAAWDFLT